MDEAHAKDLLDRERERLGGIKAELDDLRDQSKPDAVEALSSNSTHQADIATETFDREKDLTILDNIEGELADVEHALQRLDDGTYGTCEACGRPIGDDRLEAMPAARFCVNDQAEAEREVRTAQPHELAVDES